MLSRPMSDGGPLGAPISLGFNRALQSGQLRLDRDTRPFDSKRLRFEWFSRLRWLACESSKIRAMSGLMDAMTFPSNGCSVMQGHLRVEVALAVS